MAKAPASDNKTDKVRITADLPFSTVEILRRLAVSRNITMTEALRQAIGTEGLLHKRTEEDQSRVLLQSPDGKTTELLFR